MNNHFSHTITLFIQQQTLSVFKLSGEESLSQPFHFETTLILPINLNIDLTMYMPGILSIRDTNNNERNLCGIITKIQHLGLFDSEQIHLVIHLQPLLCKLKIAKSLQFFQNLTVIEIIRILLQKIGYHNTQIKLFCNKTYASQNYIQAPNETDLAFLHRLLAYAGIFYWCTSTHNQEAIYFSDNNQACSNSIQNEVFFVPPNGLNLFDINDLRYGYIYRMQIHKQLATTTFSISSFNPDISTESLEITQSTSAILQNQILQQHISHTAHNPTELEQEILLRTQRAMVDNWQLNMHSNVVLLSPGEILKLNAFHFQKTSKYNNNYLIIKLKHYTQQSSNKYELGPITNYHNEIVLIKANMSYCDPLPELPKIPACWVGHIETDNYYPLLDENGYYRLHTHYDIAKKSNINSKFTISRLSNYGSEQQHSSIGKHLPLATGAEIILSCINGNFNYPIIIGTLPNFKYLSPVTSLNKTQSMLLTQQKNLLLLDDKKDCQSIKLATEKLQNQLELNNDITQPAITIKTDQGYLNLTANKDIYLQCNNSLIEQCDNSWLHHSQQNYSVQTQNQSIFYQSAQDLQFTAKQNVLISSHNNLEIDSAEEIIIHSGCNIRFSLEDKNNLFAASQGKIVFNCAKSISFFGTGNGEIKLLTNGNGISISSDGTISCFGNIIELQTLNGVFLSTPPIN